MFGACATLLLPDAVGSLLMLNPARVCHDVLIPGSSLLDCNCFCISKNSCCDSVPENFRCPHELHCTSSPRITYISMSRGNLCEQSACIHAHAKPTPAGSNTFLASPCVLFTSLQHILRMRSDCTHPFHSLHPQPQKHRHTRWNIKWAQNPFKANFNAHTSRIYSVLRIRMCVTT
jgi:hypothetical protein